MGFSAERLPEVRYESPLVNDYLFRFDRCASLFELSPYREASFFDRQRRVREGYRTDRAALVDALAALNRRLDAGPPTLRNLERLAQPEALAVVTGQQAGILGGPLYTIYKAATAIQLARREEARLGVPVVPVFWMASEDHDWDEVARLTLLDRDWNRRDFVLQPRPDGRRSIGHVPLPPGLWPLLDEVFEALPETEFRAAVQGEVAAAARRSETLVEWFGRLMLSWFGAAGLVLADPLAPGLRRLQGGFLERVVRCASDLHDALAAGMERCRALGYPVTVDAHPHSAHLFAYVDGQRVALFRDGDRFFTRRDDGGAAVAGTQVVSDRSWSPGELARSAALRPESFSCNVVTRPLWQDALFPTLAYVGGPGEISYFALYRDTFAALGLSAPIVYPRANLTLIEPPVARYLERQGLSPADALLRLPERRAEMLRREDRHGAVERLAAFRAAVERGHAELMAVLRRVDPGLDAIGAENLRQIRAQVNRLEDKTRQHLRKQSEVFLRQFDRIELALRPRGQWQERTYNLVQFLVKYGPSLIDELLAVDLLENTAHVAVRIAGGNRPRIAGADRPASAG